MRVKYFLLGVLILFAITAMAQEFEVLKIVDGVKIEYKFKDQLLWIRATNNNAEKVYFSTGDVLWFDGLNMVSKMNGGGTTLKPGESSSSGLFWTYPTGYVQGFTFKLENTKVEVGGMGKDPRYNNSSNTNKEKLPELVFPGNEKNENKPIPDSKKDLDQLKSTFYTVSYTKALSKLGTIKQANPQKSNDYENNYRPKINYYEQIFSKEYNKGDNANPSMLRQYIRELDNLVETMGLTADADKQVIDTQKQQNQNQANDYVNKAQSDNLSPITKTMNLNLAAINATMAGNQQQLQQIQQMQAQQKKDADQKMTNDVISFFNALQQASDAKKRQQAEYAKSFFDEYMPKAQSGDIHAMHILASNFSIGDKFKGIIPDRNKSVYWYEQAADHGDTCSIFEISNDYHYYSGELNNESKINTLSYLCTGGWLINNSFDPHKSCKYFHGGLESIKTSIRDVLYYSYLSIKDKIGIELLKLLAKIYSEKITDLQGDILYGKHFEKKAAEKEESTLTRYISEIQIKIKQFPEAQQSADSVRFDDFIAANILPQYKKDKGNVENISTPSSPNTFEQLFKMDNKLSKEEILAGFTSIKGVNSESTSSDILAILGTPSKVTDYFSSVDPKFSTQDFIYDIGNDANFTICIYKKTGKVKFYSIYFGLYAFYSTEQLTEKIEKIRKNCLIFFGTDNAWKYGLKDKREIESEFGSPDNSGEKYTWMDYGNENIKFSFSYDKENGKCVELDFTFLKNNR